MPSMTPASTTAATASRVSLELVPLLCSDVDPLLRCSDFLVCVDDPAMVAAAASFGSMVPA